MIVGMQTKLGKLKPVALSTISGFQKFYFETSDSLIECDKVSNWANDCAIIRDLETKEEFKLKLSQTVYIPQK